MDEVQEQFADPALRGAIRRALNTPTAPPRLRENIAAMMATGPAFAPEPSLAPSRDRGARGRDTRGSWRLPRLPAKLVAAACLALVTVGFAAFQMREYFADFFASAPPPPPPAKFEDSFAVSIVRAHHNCAKLNDHHLVPGNDPAALQTQFAKAPAVQGMRVFAAATLGDGWQFKGAGLCKVGDAQAAHLLYVRGADQASIFSMPQAAAACASSHNYEQLVEKDVIVGFTKDNALYAIVESRADGAASNVDQARKLMSVVYNDIFDIESCSTQAAPAAKH